MKLGKYIEKNTSNLESEIGNENSEISELKLMTFESLEKELKSVILILKNSTDPEMIQYKKELESEIEKRNFESQINKIENNGIVKKYFSEVLQENLIVDHNKKVFRFETGVKYTFDEIERMLRNKYQHKDVRLLHAFKSKFGVKYVETTEVI